MALRDEKNDDSSSAWHVDKPALGRVLIMACGGCEMFTCRPCMKGKLPLSTDGPGNCVGVQPRITGRVSYNTASGGGKAMQRERNSSRRGGKLKRGKKYG